jgi:hypothetical protein
MPIKLKENQNPAEVSAKADDWSGPWGRISPTPRSVDTLRICRGKTSEEIHSYPYRVLSSWHLRGVGHDTEELKIEAGPDLITVVGHGLSRVAAALDLGSLEVLTETVAQVGATRDSKIMVSSITLENARTEEASHKRTA